MKRSLIALSLVAALIGCGLAFGAPLPPDIGLMDPAMLAGLGAGLPFMVGDMKAEDIKKLEDALAKKAGEVIETVQKALKDEVDKFDTVTTKTNEKLTEVSSEAKAAVEKVGEFKAQLLEIEQKLAKKPGGPGGEMPKSAGQLFVDSDAYRNAVKQGQVKTEAVNIGGAHLKTAIINATGQNQPLVPDARVPGIVMPATRRLTIRDLMPQMRTSSNLVQFASENVFTNNAGLQFNSPDAKENVAKAESGITFTLSNAPVETIAHGVPASKQILADAPGLQSYIDTRLMYGLKLVEETQILTGDGTAGNLSGLNANATAYNRSVSNDSMLDCLLKAMLQAALSEYSATGMVLNPIDWTQIQLLKDTQGRYLFSNPQAVTDPMLWGLPVVATNSQTSGQFLVGAFALASALWDREDATVQIYDQHDDYPIKNMVLILCEERMAITVYRSAALIKGSLPALGT